MKIRTRLNISTIFYLFTIFVVAFLTFSMLRQANKANAHLQASGQISKGVFELNILTSDYLLYHEKRSQMQWQSKYDSLQGILSKLELQSPEEDFILSQIRSHYNIIKPLFSQLVTNFEKRNINSNAAVYNPLRDRLTSLLLVESQEIVSMASQLVNKSNAGLLIAQKRTYLLAIILIVILGIVITTDSLFIDRNILKPLLKFQQGAEIIGAGNLEFSVGPESNDEVGQLARAFNQMVANLETAKAYLTLRC